MDPALPAPVPDHSGQPSVPNGRWCPYCGADLSGVPIDREHQEEAVFASAGRRLKVALAVGFVVLWLATSIFDWVDDPSTVLLPGWWSALGVVVFFYLLGFDPTGYFRRKGRG